MTINWIYISCHTNKRQIDIYSLHPEIQGILGFLGQIKEVEKCHICP
jgi:hypothetical protein